MTLNIETAIEVAQTTAADLREWCAPDVLPEGRLLREVVETLAEHWDVDSLRQANESLRAQLDHARILADMFAEDMDLQDFLADHSHELPRLSEEHEDDWARNYRYRRGGRR